MSNLVRKSAAAVTTDSLEGRAFFTELQQFHQAKGVPIQHPPIINGHEINLHILYNEVTALGGWQKVVDLAKWEEICSKLGLPKNCANGCMLLKHLYIRYLHKYERIHFHGEEGEEETRSESRTGRKSQVSILSMVPMTFHNYQVTDQMRSMVGMSQEKYIPTGYEKLCLSLLSSLPNEVDYALNIITIMSKEGRNCLQLSKVHKLIDLLLAHAGIFSEADKGLQGIIEECWQSDDSPSGDLVQFWMDTIDCADVELAQILVENVCKEGQFERLQEFADEDLFCLNRNLGCRDREGQRILRIALILKNLSFEPANMSILACHSRFLRFLLLCSNCKWSELKSVSYDIFTNISHEINFRNIDNSTITLVLRTVAEALTSQDRFLVLRGLEIVSKLCQAEGNDEMLFKTLNSNIYENLCNYLTVKDVCLLVYTLEAMYHLTELGEAPCSEIATVHKSIEVLTNLLTVDPNLYGKEALQGFKLVTIHDPEDVGLQQSHPQQTPVVQTTPQRAVPTPAATSTPKSIVTTGIYKTGTVASTHIVEQDPDTFAMTWLKTYFEMEYGSVVSKQDIYSDLVSYSMRSGHKTGIPNASSFSNCIKLAFPHSGEKKKEDSKGEICVYIDGIRRKPIPSLPQHPLTVTLPPSPTKTPPPTAGANHSPILKAHLSAPSKLVPPTSGSQSTLSQMLSTSPKVSQSSQPITTTPVKPKDGNNTTLIKSLLANKVNRNIHQRQLLHTEPDNGTTNELCNNQVNQAASTNHSIPLKPKPAIAPKKTPVNKSKAAVLLAAKLNGVQKSVGDAIKLDKNLNSLPTKTNGTVTEEDKTHEGCEKLIRSATASLPAIVQNNEYDLKRREKICKSSPLLNGLLDTGRIMSDDSLEDKLKPKEPIKLNNLQNGTTTNTTDGKINPTNGITNCIESKAPPKSTTPSDVNSDSNLSASDLSSISDIARTVESASVVINETNTLPEPVPNDKKEEVVVEKPIMATAPIAQTIIAPATVPTIPVMAKPIMTASSAVAIPIVTTSTANNQTCIQFLPVFTASSKIQFISQNNVSLCLNIIQPTATATPVPIATDQINTAVVKPPVKRPLMPSTPIEPPKKARIEPARVDCSNIIKLEPTNDDKGVIIIENGVLQSKEEVTIKSGHQTNIADIGADKKPAVDAANRDSSKSDEKDKKVVSAAAAVDDKKKKTAAADNGKLEFTCEWQGCGMTFDSAVSVYLHACEVHAPIISSTANIPCMWDKCDKQPRKRLSLMTHLQDRHCSEQVLKINALRKQQITKTGKTNIPAPQNPPAHPGYPPNAAFHAIKRHALQFVCASDVITERQEDVLARSVRLSAALILRNVARFSNVGKKRIRMYESKISLLAASKTESSATLSQCLAALITTQIEIR